MSISELLTNSLQTKDLRYLKRINPGLLLDTESAAINWALDYERRFKEPPTLTRLKDHGEFTVFVNRSLSGSPLPDLFERAVEGLKARYAIQSHAEIESEADATGTFPVARYMEIARFLSGINTDEHETIMTIDRDLIYSDQALDAAVDFGFEYIDETSGGILPGEVTLVVARTGVGKTLVVCHEAVRWARQGKRVLLVSLEMLPVHLSNRIDAMLAHFNPKLFRSRADHGRLLALRPTVELELQVIRDAGGDIMFNKGGTMTIPRLRGLIEELKPDVVVVDGVYLVRVEESKPMASWERVKAVSNGLKQLALETALPFLETSQFNRTDTKDGQGLENIGYSDALGQDADCVMGMSKDPTGPGRALLELLKVRSGETSGGITIETDWDSMLVREIPWSKTEIRLGAS